ncbi:MULTISPECIES: phosphoglycolate phosphatase [Methanoculleus]|mgnify:FL=1|uniref:Phosphoglycolate phosphatase n=1 Tax=Methanoculleus thermophilus TaxID=2200 RepID=A0A1G8XEF4_9EURY|nr:MULTISPECIES: phosphoglycolate phosphatase [Methanoculleus]NLN09549.1 phosphoglycolate phosphatase [Methanoculleus thermophilus]SDJ88796.1 phosphoglycolate phosphatase [Methanoculleus thermophilus]HQD25534.1 phosphoglycolate phosphatase [Methanoculleus thermophilus]
MLKALVTDVDGTITDRRRRINTAAIEAIRTLVDSGITVVLASGNTVCFMDGLCKMIGTDGTIIGENGGVYRRTFSGTLNISGDQKVCLAAFEELRDYFAEKGIELELFGAQYRFADVAFARNIDADEARAIIRDRHLPVRVLDTGFAIHLQVLGVNKGTALRELAGELGIHPDEMMAIGDSENDIEMLRAAGVGVAVRNAPALTQSAADWVSQGMYGEGFVEAVKKYYPDLFSR